MKFILFCFALFLFCWTSTYTINRQAGFPFEEPDLLFPAKVDLTFTAKSDDQKKSKLIKEQIRGKKLFRENCASCHRRNMVDDMTGPALRGVTERWEGREKLLYEWIKNSQAVIDSGDAYAVSLYKKWDNSTMNAFPKLTDEDIADLLSYIERE